MKIQSIEPSTTHSKYVFDDGSFHLLRHERNRDIIEASTYEPFSKPWLAQCTAIRKHLKKLSKGK